jgi:hypothetical protein
MTPPSTTLVEPPCLRHPATLLLDPKREWYSCNEAADILGVSGQFVRNCFDDQSILGHEIGVRANKHKRYKLIHRDCLLMYLLETANYSDREFSDRLQGILKRRSNQELRLVKGWIEERLASKETF